jgi:hypothetical protein
MSKSTLTSEQSRELHTFGAALETAAQQFQDTMHTPEALSLVEFEVLTLHCLISGGLSC